MAYIYEEGSVSKHSYAHSSGGFVNDGVSQGLLELCIIRADPPVAGFTLLGLIADKPRLFDNKLRLGLKRTSHAELR